MKLVVDTNIIIAAALATGADVWSDDAHFERQEAVRVWKTRELASDRFILNRHL